MIKIRVGKKKKSCGKPLYEDEKLSEVTDDEVEHIEDALESMDGEDLAFNDIFNGKMRLILPFRVYNENSELGKFLALFRRIGWNADFEAGKVSKGKTTIRIGAFLQKIEHLVAKILHHETDIDRIIKGTTADLKGLAPDWMNRSEVPEQKTKLLQKLKKALLRYVPDRSPEWMDPEMWLEMFQYWEKNAAYIRKNLESATKGHYSLIMTRSPIDVLRMSDFDNIHSCHSPPSRAGVSGGSYYKCAVAEAHGHGAVGYVVKSEDLRDMYESDSLEDIENSEEFQRDEVFADSARGFESPTAPGSIEPLTRLRLRQFRVDPDDGSDEYEIGVPEKVVYGMKFPDAYGILVQWAQSVQQEQIRNIPTDEDGTPDFDKVTRYGGSWIQDPANELLAKLIGVTDWTGEVESDTQTEDRIDANVLGGSLQETLQDAMDHVADIWTERYRHCVVNVQVEIEEGDVYEPLDAIMTFKWPLPDIPKMITPRDASYIVDELREVYGLSYFKSEGPWPSVHTQGRSSVSEGEVWIGVHLDPSWMMQFGWDQPYLLGDDMVEEFDVFGRAVDQIDDAYDELHGLMTEVLANHGFIPKGNFQELAQEIEDGQFDPVEWDMDATEYPYGSGINRFERISAVNELQISVAALHQESVAHLGLEGMMQELKSHLFPTTWRTRLLRPGQTELGIPYNVDIHVNVELVDDEYIQLLTEFSLTPDDRSEQVELLKYTVDFWDDEEEMVDSVQGLIANYLWHRARKRGLKETKKPNVEFFVKMWKGKF